MTRDLLTRDEQFHNGMDAWRLYDVISIYNSVFCPVCSRQQPHIELQHWTGNNARNKWDDHRRETSLNCLGHTDTQLLPEQVIASARFYDDQRDHWFHCTLMHRPVGPIASKFLGTTATDSYSYDFRTSQDKAGKRPLESHWGGCGPIYDLDGFPFDKSQKYRNYCFLNIMIAMMENKKTGKQAGKQQNIQLSLF